MWQTNHVAELLGVEVENVVVQTLGDTTQKTNAPIESMRGQGVFVKEVQAAVLEGRADFAVHSAKDLPSDTADGLILAAVPERGDPRDALIGCALEDLPAGARIGTGSVRRRAQLAFLRPDLTFANLRGNVDTRIAKAGDFDAIVMAYAPIQRLQRTDVTAHVLSPATMLPQVAQGALAVECREDDEETIELLQSIEHVYSRIAVDAERAYLSRLGGGCDLPVGAHATVSAHGEIAMRALLASLDGRIALRARGTGNDPEQLGRKLAEQLLFRDGGSELLLSHKMWHSS